MFGDWLFCCLFVIWLIVLVCLLLCIVLLFDLLLLLVGSAFAVRLSLFKLRLCFAVCCVVFTCRVIAAVGLFVSAVWFVGCVLYTG